MMFLKLIGIGLVAAFVLTSCNAAATPVATADATATLVASPNPVEPTTTATAAPTVADTPTPVATATQAATDTAISTPQVNPGMNAYCRKGPGTGYYAITFLQAGTFYNVTGQNGLGTWWLVQVPGNITCWMGDPTSVTQGPLWQASIVMVPPLPDKPSDFVNIYTCSATGHTLEVSFTWTDGTNATGYNIYRNGTLLATVGPKVAAYNDNAAPLKVDLKYQLEAFNDYGVADRVKTTIVPACD
jgi:hypothetical protein